MISSDRAGSSTARATRTAARIEMARAGTQVVGVHVGYVDTDLTAGLPVDKVAPQAVAVSALDALEQNRPEAIVDEFSRSAKAGLHDDQNLIYPRLADQFNAAPVG
jgi:NAD(P)-dependent dehydrogenase (short-subunit alcohol dehydrogenase family)